MTILLFKQLHHLAMNIHAIHHLAAPTATAASITDKPSAHASRTTLDHHLLVAPNALSVPNVRWKKRVLTTNAQIHARIPAELALCVIQPITIQFVHALQVLPAIHSHNAQEFVS